MSSIPKDKNWSNIKNRFPCKMYQDVKIDKHLQKSISKSFILSILILIQNQIFINIIPTFYLKEMILVYAYKKNASFPTYASCSHGNYERTSLTFFTLRLIFFIHFFFSQQWAHFVKIIFSHVWAQVWSVELFNSKSENVLYIILSTCNILIQYLILTK